MGIVRRLNRLISADIHGLLDLLEDPVDSCKQAIREMEEEVTALKSSIKSRDDRLRRMDEQRSKLSERVLEAERQVELCLRGADEQLTRQSIKRRIEQEKLKRYLTDQSELLSGERAREAAQLAEYEERLSAIREKLECLADHEALAKTDLAAAECTGTLQVTEEEIELALLAAKQGQGSIQR